MPRVIITSLSPGQLFRHALDHARKASAEILRLKSAPLEPGETLNDRTLRVAGLAHELAEMFEIVDTLAAAAAADTEPVSGANASPPQSKDRPLDRWGVPQGDDPTVN